MAENAAHFTTTLEAKPSIFEVVAQNSLNATLYPALQKVAVFLGSVNPRTFSWVSEYYDEVFFILNGLLQSHYLRTTGATFSEHFYGLQRSPINLESSKLVDAHKKLSLAFLIILPYVKRKLEEKVAVYKLQNAEGTLEMASVVALPVFYITSQNLQNFHGICKKSVVVTYSLLEISFGVWTLVQYLHYMSGKSECQTPVLRLLNLKLIYSVEPQDALGFWTALFRGQLSFLEMSKALIQNTAKSALELTAFFIQFLQAWNAERSNYSFSGLPAVPPPEQDNKAAHYKDRCPLCLQSWKIPTVVPVSGYVFCFPCIVRHLREHPYCPVTNLPAKPLDVIRLYDS